MYIGLHVKWPLLSSDFNGTGIFLTGFRKILEYHISWKSVQQEPSCSMWTDGHTRRSWQSLFAVLWTRLQTSSRLTVNTFSSTKTKLSILFRETITDWCEGHKRQKNYEVNKVLGLGLQEQVFLKYWKHLFLNPYPTNVENRVSS